MSGRAETTRGTRKSDRPNAAASRRLPASFARPTQLRRGAAYRFPTRSHFESTHLIALKLGVVIAALGPTLAGSTTPALSQAPIVIPAELSCPDCSISVQKIASLGKQSGEGMLTTNSAFAARDSAGRFYVCETRGEPRIAVFDGAGQFLTYIGRAGAGPGEFRTTTAMGFTSDGRFAVMDATLRRISFFSRDYAYLESFSLPMRAKHDTVLVTEGLVIAEDTRAAATAGYPLHLVALSDGRGQIVRSFGSEDGFATPLDASDSLIGRTSSGDAVWSVDPDDNGYRIERWTTSGELREVLVQSEDGWFADREEFAKSEFPRSYETVTYTRPRITALRQDDDGYLWVYTLVPDADLGSLIGDEYPDRPGFFRVGGTRNETQDTLIEVLDTTAFVPVARAQVDQVVYPGDGNIISTVVESEDGAIRLDVFEAKLETASRPW